MIKMYKSNFSKCFIELRHKTYLIDEKLRLFKVRTILTVLNLI